MVTYCIEKHGEDGDPILITADRLIEGRDKLEFRNKNGDLVGLVDKNTIARFYLVNEEEASE
jgi:hypothetical protein